MRPCVETTTRLWRLLVWAIASLGFAPTLSAQEDVAVPPIGLSSARYETPDGSSHLVPGPYVDIDGQPYVPVLRRRWHESHSLGVLVSPGKGSSASSALSSNLHEILVNDPMGQTFGYGNTQTEPSVAVSGDTIVCGFTDSEGLFIPGVSASGFAYSFDRGVTWVDAGSLPLRGLGGSEMLLGDPVVCTDQQGRWYYISVYDVGNAAIPGTGDLGLAISYGRFVAGTLVWSLPGLLAGGTSAGSALLHHHATLDADNDRLYVTYTNATPPLGGWGQIEIVTLINHATQIQNSLILQPEIYQTNNAGSRLAVGVAGELYCAWESGVLGGGDGQGPAFQKVARSLDHGLSFEPAVVAATVIESWFSNPPGSNREDFNVEFPSIAVDRNPGPDQGRVYLAWHEAIEMDFNSPYATFEEPVDPNDTPQTATVLPDSSNHFLIHGHLNASDSVDYYRFNANEGEHFRAIGLVESGLLSMEFRLWCANPSGGGADTLLALSARGALKETAALITLPYTGEYVVRMKRRAQSGDYDLYLRKTTETLPSVAADHRDIVLVSSPDGVSSWTAKVRVNDDATPSDQAMPEIVVDDLGVHLVWYDRRYDPRCHAAADFVLASSLDAGATFMPNLRLTSQSFWWQVLADAVPNFGDFVRGAAAQNALYLPWCDGRLGSPDVRLSRVRSGFELQVPDFGIARENELLEVEFDVANGVASGDTVDVSIAAAFDGTVAPVSYVAGPLSAWAGSTLVYSAFVDSTMFAGPPCTLAVSASSRLTGRIVSESIPIFFDATIPVELADFKASYQGGWMQLAWRADDRARFEVYRSHEAAGPYVQRTTEPISATGADRFEYRDADVESGRRYLYRLMAIEPDGSGQFFGPYEAFAAAPPRVTLLGAHPNPFNPRTEIAFELPQATQADLRILDVRGRQIATLLQDERRSAGSHRVSWDGYTEVGTAAASGLYLAELMALGQRRTVRIVLLR